MGQSHSNYRIPLPGHHKVVIIQNTYSPTSKVPTVYHSLNNVSKFNLFWDSCNPLTVIPYKINIKEKIFPTYIKYRKCITIPKCREEGIVKKYCTNVRLKTSRQTPTLCVMFKCSSDIQICSALLTTTHVFLLDWFHALLAALLGRYTTSLASLTSCVLQGNPGFNFTASANGLSTWPPTTDTLDTCQTSVAYLTSKQIP